MPEGAELSGEEDEGEELDEYELDELDEDEFGDDEFGDDEEDEEAYAERVSQRNMAVLQRATDEMMRSAQAHERSQQMMVQNLAQLVRPEAVRPKRTAQSAPLEAERGAPVV